MTPPQLLQRLGFGRGYMDSRAELAESLEGYAARGSRNGKVIGDGRFEPFRGLQSKGANTGSRIMTRLGNTWGGIKDIGATVASGSVYEHIAKTLLFIGAGQVHKEGTNITNAIASSILQLMIATNGNYTTPPYQAGLPQPSAPDVGILDAFGTGYSGYTDGAISIVLERRRPETGARSIASLPSVVIIPRKKSFYVVFPLAATGQTEWAVFATNHGLGANGVHRRLGYQYSIYDIPESLVASSTLNGIPRCLEFDYRNGDLLPEEASVVDYPPNAGTHVVQLENATVILGAFADSVASPSAGNAGTVGLVSLDNHPESYNPNHRIYFPEGIVDVLSRMTDSYAYVACRNSIWAIQYVGDRGDFLPSVTISNVIPDAGIAKPCNWTQAFGLIYLWLEGVGIVGMTADGEIDYDLGAGVSELTKDWDSNTVLSFDPRTRSIVAMNNDVSVSLCLQNRSWSYPCYAKDYGIAGNYMAAVSSRGEMIVTVTNGGVSTAHTYDKGASRAPVLHVSQWFAPSAINRTNSIYEIGAAIENGANTEPLLIGLHKNLEPVVLENLRITSVGSVVEVLEGLVMPDDVGKRIAVIAENVSGPNNFAIGKIANVSGNFVEIVDIATASPLSLSIISRGFAIVGDDIFAVNQKANRLQHLDTVQPDMPDAMSAAVSIFHPTDAVIGQILAVEVYGSTQGGNII